MKFRSLVIGLVLMAASAFAADIDGKWAGNIDTPNGALTIGFTFKQDGAALTGTMTGPDGAEIKISDGKVTGNKVSFNAVIDFGGMPVTIAYTGELAGANMKLVMDFAGMPIELALKKA
ncbi:MAG: hypothetical protein ABIR70_08975 [Bryobacteraceae bacterium]